MGSDEIMVSFDVKSLFTHAIGSPVSPLGANLFMEYLEKIAIDTSLNPVRFWKRYVDDIFCILHKSTVDSFLEH